MILRRVKQPVIEQNDSGDRYLGRSLNIIRKWWYKSFVYRFQRVKMVDNLLHTGHIVAQRELNFVAV